MSTRELGEGRGSARRPRARWPRSAGHREGEGNSKIPRTPRRGSPRIRLRGHDRIHLAAAGDAHGRLEIVRRRQGASRPARFSAAPLGKTLSPSFDDENPHGRLSVDAANHNAWRQSSVIGTGHSSRQMARCNPSLVGRSSLNADSPGRHDAIGAASVREPPGTNFRGRHRETASG